jgi:hypothetical protein
MPFCTTCGASVTGAFCNQCGTPVGAAAQGQPVPAAPYRQPVGPGPQPGPRKTSPVVLALLIVLGLFVFGGIATLVVVRVALHHVREAGLIPERGRDGGVSFNVRGSDGKNAHIEIGASAGKLPSWVPVYPGSEGHANFAVKGTGDNDEGEGGNVTFTTSDDATRVKSFYADKCKEMGMKVDLETTTPEGGMFIAADEGGEKRSLTVVIGGHAGETTVNVTYGAKLK